MARSVALALAATRSELFTLKWRMNLSFSLVSRLAARTPCTDQSRWVRARSTSVRRRSW